MKNHYENDCVKIIRKIITKNCYKDESEDEIERFPIPHNRTF